MPPAEAELASAGAPPAEESSAAKALRTTFEALPDKTALRAALDAFWDDYGVQIWRGTSTVFRVHALALIAVGWFFVWLCAPSRLHFVHDSSTIEIVFGVIFPLTYAIGQSFTRRERCADVMAQMKAASLSLYFLHRDFDVCARPASDGNDGKEAAPGVGGVSARNVSVVLRDLMSNVRSYLQLERPSVDREHDEGVVHYNRCVADFSSLSVLNERLAFRANYANGAMNRANEYLRVLIVGLDQLRVVHRYSGSPMRMQYFCAFMVHVSPIFLAPYFRHFCPEFDKNKGTSPRNVCVPAYLSSGIFCAVLSTLFAVAVDMSNPFDMVGADDLHFQLDTEIEEATRALPHPINAVTGEVELAWSACDGPRSSTAPRNTLQFRTLARLAVNLRRISHEGREAPAGDDAARLRERERSRLLAADEEGGSTGLY